MSAPSTLLDYGVAVLTSASPDHKAHLTQEAAQSFFLRHLEIGTAVPPDRPARPARPILAPAHSMPKRTAQDLRGRIALIHALAHIELNAIDLAWDLLCRFGGASSTLPRDFYSDWIKVAAEEAKHFRLLSRRLETLGAAYGDLPAHDGLWAAAQRTGHDLLARLAVIPLVHEARGLDVTPGMIARLRQAGDHRSARILTLISREEIGHVRAGRVWFDYAAAKQGLNAAETFRDLVTRYHGLPAMPPFNEASRRAASLSAYHIDY